jgi:hypothetical protein
MGMYWKSTGKQNSKVLHVKMVLDDDVHTTTCFSSSRDLISLSCNFSSKRRSCTIAHAPLSWHPQLFLGKSWNFGDMCCMHGNQSPNFEYNGKFYLEISYWENLLHLQILKQLLENANASRYTIKEPIKKSLAMPHINKSLSKIIWVAAANTLSSSDWFSSASRSICKNNIKIWPFHWK